MNKIKKSTIFLIIILIIIIIVINIFFYKKIYLFSKKHSKQENIFNTEWTVTQFGENLHDQMMSFVIEGNKYGLVIIDGGYIDKEEQYNFLMNKIEKHNNVVNAWIVTHFDSDHAGEFVRIVQDSNVKIEKIYVADFPTDIEMLQNNLSYEEDWSIYSKYLSLDLPQKVKVHENDKFEIIDLKMKVLSAYEDWIDEKTNNLLNNGSIIFKIYGNKESILFCGDAQDKLIGEYLLNNHKNDLKSDFIQVGHHGNNSFEKDFYKAVNPKVAFFCAPDWLINN